MVIPISRAISVMVDLYELAGVVIYSKLFSNVIVRNQIKYRYLNSQVGAHSLMVKKTQNKYSAVIRFDFL
jgi:hypothetical protein